MGTHIRVVVGRPSSTGDDEDVTPEVAGLARTLRDAGMEVVLVAGGQTPEHLARIAVQEDAAAVALTVGDPAARDLVARVERSLAAHDAADIHVIGYRPARSASAALARSPQELVDWIRDAVSEGSST